jgi:chromate transporter
MTFIGWMKAGGWGASFATLGMFLPSFFFALVALPFARQRLAASSLGRTFVAWVMPAVVGALFASALFVLRNVLEPTLSVSAIFQWVWIGTSIYLTAWRKWPAWMVIPGAGVINWTANWAYTFVIVGVR